MARRQDMTGHSAAKIHHDHVQISDGHYEDNQPFLYVWLRTGYGLSSGSHHLWDDVKTISRPWGLICLAQP